MKKTVAGTLAVGLLLAGFSVAQAQQSPSRAARVFDTSAEPAYNVSLGLLPNGKFTNDEHSSIVEINGDWAFAYFWDVLGGDIDLNARLRSFVFTDSAGLELPSQVAQAALNAGWTWRFEHDAGLQLRTLPGIYSDFERLNSRIFYMPVSLTAGKAFDPRMAGYLGLELRPGFDRLIMPIICLDAQIADPLRLKAGLPESRLTYQMNKDWSTHVGLNWDSLTFTVKDQGDWERDQMSMEDLRAYWGMKIGLSDQVRLVGDLGWVFGRTIRFDGGSNANNGVDIDIDSGMFVRFGVEGSY